MTKGIVLFAQNNSEIDYVKIATYAARQAQKYLQVPVSIITDSPDWLRTSQPDHPFDKIIGIHQPNEVQRKQFFDGKLSSTRLDWKNFARNQAYELSPYDITLVIDSDFIINSDVLKTAFDKDVDFQIYSQSIDLAGWRSNQEFERINPQSIDFYWATVFVFKKNPLMESFFNLIAYIKTNWNYFRKLYNIEGVLFRNDYAFSIAIHIMDGKIRGNFAIELPGKMTYIRDTDILVEAVDGTMKFLVGKKDFAGEYILAKTTNLDVHVMNKFSLSRFIDGGCGV